MAHDYPKGWEAGTGETIAHRHLEDFKYAEITYDGDIDRYRLWKSDHDGPAQLEKHGIFNDLGKAFEAGNRL